MAQLTLADLHLEIDAQFPDNTTELITPGIVRTFLHELVAAVQQLAALAATLPLTATLTADSTLPLAAAGQLVPVASSSAVTVFVPANVDVPFPVGTTLYVAQDGTGSVTIAAAPGVVIQTADGYKVSGQWQDVALHKRDLDTWVLKGGVS